jgi:uncharacterized protein YdeI (YjbR/CyaY-like superfamily)
MARLTPRDRSTESHGGSESTGELRGGLQVLHPTSQPEWESWLGANHERVAGVWLKVVKRGCKERGLTYAEAVEGALMFGWIDGQGAPFDERFWLQRFTPRKPRSRWSQINRARALALIEARTMMPAGLAEVKRAQADGRWEAAYAGQRTASVPEELQRALDRDPQASAFFATLDSANRYAIIYRVNEAKRAETRARRIEKFVAMLRAGETIHPPRRGKAGGA